MDINQIVQTVAIYALPVLFAITLHEAAHGYVARHFGDMTAYAQGRISLNPARHFDWLGTLVIPIVILVLSSGKFLFGWAKPVPVNYSALRSPRRHMLWVAAAGPASNLAMAIGWALLLKIALVVPVNMFTEAMLEMGKAASRSI
jgi:Zn-dependent protease